MLQICNMCDFDNINLNEEDGDDILARKDRELEKLSEILQKQIE